MLRRKPVQDQHLMEEAASEAQRKVPSLGNGLVSYLVVLGVLTVTGLVFGGLGLSAFITAQGDRWSNADMIRRINCTDELGCVFYPDTGTEVISGNGVSGTCNFCSLTARNGVITGMSTGHPTSNSTLIGTTGRISLSAVNANITEIDLAEITTAANISCPTLVSTDVYGRVTSLQGGQCPDAGIDGTYVCATATYADGVLVAIINGTAPVTSVVGTSGQITSSCTSGVCTESLANFGPGASSCTYCSLTVDAKGRVSVLSSGVLPATSVSCSGANCSLSGGVLSINVSSSSSGITDVVGRPFHLEVTSPSPGVRQVGFPTDLAVLVDGELSLGWYITFQDADENVQCAFTMYNGGGQVRMDGAFEVVMGIIDTGDELIMRPGLRQTTVGSVVEQLTPTSYFLRFNSGSGISVDTSGTQIGAVLTGFGTKPTLTLGAGANCSGTAVLHTYTGTNQMMFVYITTGAGACPANQPILTFSFGSNALISTGWYCSVSCGNGPCEGTGSTGRQWAISGTTTAFSVGSVNGGLTTGADYKWWIGPCGGV